MIEELKCPVNVSFYDANGNAVPYKFELTISGASSGVKAHHL